MMKRIFSAVLTASLVSTSSAIGLGGSYASARVVSGNTSELSATDINTTGSVTVTFQMLAGNTHDDEPRPDPAGTRLKISHINGIDVSKQADRERLEKMTVDDAKASAGEMYETTLGREGTATLTLPVGAYVVENDQDEISAFTLLLPLGTYGRWEYDSLVIIKRDPTPETPGDVPVPPGGSGESEVPDDPDLPGGSSSVTDTPTETTSTPSGPSTTPEEPGDDDSSSKRPWWEIIKDWLFPEDPDDDGGSSSRPWWEFWKPTTSPTPKPSESPGATTTPPQPSVTDKPSEPTETETPGTTPAPTPGQTPGDSPVPTPGETPGETPGQTPAPTPGETPDETPGETPAPTPGVTPGQTPGQTPSVTVTPTPGDPDDPNGSSSSAWPWFLVPIIALIGGSSEGSSRPDTAPAPGSEEQPESSQTDGEQPDSSSSAEDNQGASTPGADPQASSTPDRPQSDDEAGDQEDPAESQGAAVPGSPGSPGSPSGGDQTQGQQSPGTKAPGSLAETGASVIWMTLLAAVLIGLGVFIARGRRANN